MHNTSKKKIVGRGRPRKSPAVERAKTESAGYSPAERLRIGGALRVGELCALKGISRSKFFKDQRAGTVATDGGVVTNAMARRYLGLPELAI